MSIYNSLAPLFRNKRAISTTIMFSLVITVLISGCMNPLEGDVSSRAAGGQTGSLSIQVGRGIGASTWQPSEEARRPHRYEVTGQGPLGAGFSKTIDITDPDGSEDVDIPTLLAGSWEITVDGYNSDGAHVATGFSTVAVNPGSESGVTVHVRPVVGEGFFDVSIDWTAALSSFESKHSDISATGTLYQGWGASRSVVPLDVTTDSSSWAVAEYIASGWYVFEFALTDTDFNGNAVDIYTIREAVRIMGDGLVTAADVQISAEDVAKRGEIGLTIDIDMEDAIDLTFGESAPIILYPGDEVTVSVAGVPEGAQVEWAVGRNVRTGKTGSSFSVNHDELLRGPNTISVIVRYQNRLSSVSLRVERVVPDITITGGDVQLALNMAEPGDVIEVRGGTYDGFTVSTNDLTIFTVDGAVIQPVDQAGVTAGVYVSSNTTGLRLYGFKVDGSAVSDSIGVVGNPGAEFTVDSMIFQELTTGIVANASPQGDGTVTAAVLNSTFTDNGVGIDHTEETVFTDIAGNEFSGNQTAIVLIGTVALAGDGVGDIKAYISANNVLGDDPVIDDRMLYQFTSFTFTNGTQTGRTGPSRANLLATSAYNSTQNPWLGDTNFFDVAGGIQIWTVPQTGRYRIEAAGARGSQGGRGARLSGEFELAMGQKVRILVGQMGSGTSGGGGGTFVVLNNGPLSATTEADILVIAGGGGGRSNGSNATTTTANANGSVSNGNGGSAVSTPWAGPAGGGFFTSGVVSTGWHSGMPGSGFRQGGVGGANHRNQPAHYGIAAAGAGGFGGGGSGGGDAGAGGGGGGGYSGGSGSPERAGGVGAGSFNAGENKQTHGLRAGHGLVIIERLP